MLELLAPDLGVAALVVGLGLVALGGRGVRGLARPAVFGWALVGLAVFVSLAAAFVSPWMCLPVGLVLGLVFAGLATRGSQGGVGLVFTALLSLGVIQGYATFVHEWQHTIAPASIIELPPGDNVGIDDRTLVFFRGAECRPDLQGQHSWKFETRTNTSTVAPLVPKGWLPHLPVVAWMDLGQLPSHGQSPEEACDRLGEGTVIQGLLRPRDLHVEAAIAAGLETHGLREAPGALVFRFAPSQRRVEQSLGLGRAVAGVLAGLWLLALLLDLWDARKNAGTPAPPTA